MGQTKDGQANNRIKKTNRTNIIAKLKDQQCQKMSTNFLCEELENIIYSSQPYEIEKSLSKYVYSSLIEKYSYD